MKWIFVLLLFFSFNANSSVLGKCIGSSTDANMTLQQCVDTIPYIPDYGLEPDEFFSSLRTQRIDQATWFIYINNLRLRRWFTGWDGGNCPNTSDGFPLDNGSCQPDPPTCLDGEILDPDTNTCKPAPTCPEAGTLYKTLYGRTGFDGYSTCLSNNCVVTLQPQKPVQVCTGAGTGEESCGYQAFYTGQVCDADNSVDGMMPPDHVWPDTPTHPTDQTPTEPTVPTDPNTPDGSGSGGGSGGGDSGTVKPNPDPQPQPDNPNLSEGDNALLKEQNLTNQHLQNIEHAVNDLKTATNDNAKDLINYQKHMLGQLTELNGKGTGGGGGSDPNATNTLNDIKCLLDEKCEGGGSQSSVIENQCSSFECDGDAVVCYIARKQWAEKCEIEDFLKDGGTGSQIGSSLDQFIADNPVEDLDAGTLNVNSVMNKYTNGGGVELSGSCPASRTIDASITSFTLDYQPFCDLANVINWFLIAFSLVSSGLLIAKYGL